MPTLTLFLGHVGLALRLSATHPQVPPEEAIEHAQAAVAAATPQVSPELLLAIAFIESRFDPLAVSRVEGKKRRVGRYPSTQPPKRLRRGASLYCGPLQTFAPSWDECMQQRNLVLAYQMGAKEVREWLRHKRVRGDMTRALAGYGCGNRGARTGKCNRYPGRVLYQARRLTAPAHSSGTLVSSRS